MTVIRPNSISGITSITAQANEINVFRSNGLIAGLNLNGVNFNTTAGISTLAALKVTGNLDVEGVLTYQDVTNVDSLGIGTFRTGINVSGGEIVVGSNIKIGNAGIITASGLDISGDIDVDGHTNLDNVSIAGVATAQQIRYSSGGSYWNGHPRSVVIGYSGSNYANLGMGWVPTSTNDQYTSANSDYQSRLQLYDGLQIYGSGASVTSGQTVTWNTVADFKPGAIKLYTSGSSNSEKLRIDSSGKLLLGDGTYNSNSNGFKMSIKESSNENAAIMFLDTDNMKGGICGIAKGTNQIITGTTNVDFVLGSVYADTHIIYGTPSNQVGAIGMTLKADTGHIVIEEGLGIGGVDPGGSTLKVNGSLNLSQGGNTSWQKVSIEGSNNTAGDAFSINNWGDAEGDYWGLMVNQTMNQSGNYSKTNSGKRTSFITLDGRMGRVYLGGAGTGTNPTEHFYTNWDGTVYMNSGFGSVAPFYGVRAWVQGNSGTTNASGGLSSMSRISTGRFRLNFATTMPDDNYATGCLANNNYDDTSWHGNTETTRVDVHFYTGSSYVDPSEWSAWVIR